MEKIFGFGVSLLLLFLTLGWIYFYIFLLNGGFNKIKKYVYWLLKIGIKKWYRKKSYYVDIFLIFIGIFLISLLLSGNLNLHNEIKIQEVVFSSIGIISGILGITFSIFLLFLQGISSTYSGHIYFILSRQKKPIFIFSAFISLIILDLALFGNIFNLNEKEIVFGMVFIFLISLYLVWDLFSWSKKIGNPENFILEVANYILRKLHSENRKISKRLSKKPDEEISILLYLQEYIGNDLYNSIILLLDEYTSKLDNKKEQTANAIMRAIHEILKNFILIFRGNFLAYPDFNVVLSNNVTFLNFFTEVFLELERRVGITLINENYKGTNEIINLYYDCIIASSEIELKGAMYMKDNLILSNITGSYIKISKEIILKNSSEGSFRWLVNSKGIIIQLLDKKNLNNFPEIVKNLKSFLKVQDNIVYQEIFYNFGTIFKYINNKPLEARYEYHIIDDVFKEYAFICLVNLAKNRGMNIDFDIKIQESYNDILILFSSKLNDRIRVLHSLLTELIENIKIYKEAGGVFKNDLHLKYFSSFLIDLYKRVSVLDYMFIEVITILHDDESKREYYLKQIN